MNTSQSHTNDLPRSYEDSVRLNDRRLTLPCHDEGQNGSASRSEGSNARPCAVITEVDEGSPAWDAGFEPGYAIGGVGGNVVHDIIDWRWLSADDEMDVTFLDPKGERGEVHLERDPGEGWGFHFDRIVFDDVYQCKNACLFCFMRQLPDGSRASLRLRDDDFRLSFLEGTYVTFTNLDDEQVRRIIDERISPLRFSLHAVSPDLRRTIIGKHAKRGMQVAETLLAHGIQLHVQIVLMPGVNDGDELQRTIDWCWRHPGIVSVGIVPLGYTSFQTQFHTSFQAPDDSKRVISQIDPMQRRARASRGSTWVYLADEFYRNAYGNRIMDHLPTSSEYDGYPLFEDGIGMLRSTFDEWEGSRDDQRRLADVLRERRIRIHAVCGEALREFFPQLLLRSPLSSCMDALFVQNKHFGGNVNVTGLLCADDIVPAAKRALTSSNDSSGMHHIVVIPDVIFNADAVTLDGCSIVEMSRSLRGDMCVVSCEAPKVFHDIQEFIKGRF